MILCPLAGTAAACSLAASANAARSDANAQPFCADAQVLAKGMAALFDKRLKPMIAQRKDARTRARAG